MLITLRVTSFILIDALELQLAPGFNVLTGETGAGKSIIVGALNLVLGGRARADMVQPGASEATVEALFDVRAHAATLERLENSGVPCDGELVIRRVVQSSGRSRAYLNGRLCTITELATVAAELADVTSQHESVALADPARHLRYLDGYAHLDDLRDQVSVRVEALRELRGQIAQIVAGERDRIERTAFAQYQLNVIDQLAPQAGELERLESERQRLRHGERLTTTTSTVANTLGEDDGLCDRLGRLVALLQDAAALDKELMPLAVDLEGCWAQMQESAHEVAIYADQVEADPARLEAVQERLYKLEQLLRKHGPTMADVLATQERLQTELAAMEGAETRLPELRQERDEQLARTAKRAKKLSAGRRRAGKRLGEAISHELAELGMGRARVVVDLSQPEGGADELTVSGARLGRDGIDRAQFLIAPNPGMDPRPLARIASGGELSRALLALKRVLGGYAYGRAEQRQRAAGIQVFDEVDAGVGGATADKIGRAIAGIAPHRQVLCITHLASIAAHAEAHYVVRKSETKECSRSAIQQVVGRARVAELARMLTGENAARSSLKAARDLLAAVQLKASSATASSARSKPAAPRTAARKAAPRKAAPRKAAPRKAAPRKRQSRRARAAADVVDAAE